MSNKKDSRRLKIRKSIRAKISGTSSKPRLTVFKSNTSIYAQLIDDSTGHTLVSSSSIEVDGDKNANVEISNTVGKRLAEKAIATGIASVVFDRSGYLYHGKLKALAEGAREGGLKF